MRHFGASRRTRNHVVLANRIAAVAEAQFTLTLEDEEHFLLPTVAMERTLRLSGRKHGQVVAELLGADVVADRGALGRIESILLDVVELDLIEVHDGLRHGSSSDRDLLAECASHGHASTNARIGRAPKL